MNKLFTSDKFFQVTTWFSILATLFFSLMGFMYYPDFGLSYMVRLIISVCMAVMYIAYQKHEKNVMKGMMGAILMGIVVLSLVFYYGFPEYSVYTLIFVALTVALFINHFVINSDRYARPNNILANQILALLNALFSIVFCAFAINDCINIFDTVATILIILAQPCFMLSIICVESRLDAYRTDREAAGWTEEKGYPKDYVHEYQKTKIEK